MADWTVEEAQAYLPRLRALLAVVRRAAEVSARARSNGHRDLPSPGPSAADATGGADAADAADGAPAEAPASGDASASGETVSEIHGLGPAEALSELEERGIVLRDAERGLVDFPSRHPGGRPVLLCWQLGEEDLEWWHLPEDGFAGRRRLPLPPEL